MGSSNSIQIDPYRTSCIEKAHKSWIQDIKICPDQKSFITCSYDKTIKRWSLNNTQPIHEFLEGCHNSTKYHLIVYNSIEPVQCLEINHAGTRLYSGSGDKSIKIWSLENNKLIKTVNNAHRGVVYTLLLIRSDQYMLSAGEDRCISIWKVENDDLKLAYTIKHAHKGRVL